MVNTGFSLSDLLENDFETILDVVTSSEETAKSEKEEVMSLEEFMKRI